MFLTSNRFISHLINLIEFRSYFQFFVLVQFLAIILAICSAVTSEEIEVDRFAEGISNFASEFYQVF